MGGDGNGLHRDALADGPGLGAAAGRAAGHGGAADPAHPSEQLAAVPGTSHDASSSVGGAAVAPQRTDAGLGAACAAGSPDASAGVVWRRASWANVVVVIPTVAGREAALSATLRQLERAGTGALVCHQPDDIPPSATAQRANAERAIAAGLQNRTEATHLLFVEDDIEISPMLEHRLPDLLVLDVPITLFTSARMFYPAWVKRALSSGTPIAPCVVPVRSLSAWFGSQAVLLPRRVAEGVLDWQSDRYCWDIHLKAYLLEHKIPLHVVIPNLVQHQGIRSTVRSRGGIRSVTFGWPTA